MKKVYFLIFLVLLSACSLNNTNKDKSSTFVLTGKKIESGQPSKTSRKFENKKIELTEFDKEIIKIAIKNDKNMCNKLSKDKVNYCKNLVDKEIENYKKLNCDKLVYLKQNCLNEKFLKEGNCKKITNELKKKQCIFQKEYEKAIRNKDKTFCNKLPRIKRQECLQNILTK